jgi:outer membrane protein assembly factor BamB
MAGALAAGCCLLPAALGAQSNPAPEGGETQRVAAVRKLADDAYLARDAETGNLRLRNLIETHPGRWEIARPALETIFKASVRDGLEDWQEYAAVRLIAAYRAGRILPTDPVMREAWSALITIRGYQDRFLEARAEIAELEQTTGRDVWTEFLEAELCYQADSYETESRFAEILAKISADDSDPCVRAVWQSIVPSDGRKPNPRYLESAMNYQPGRRQPSDAPRNLSLKDVSPNWVAAREPPPETVPSQLHVLIGEALEPGRFIADDRAATTTWLWSLIDRHLLSQKPEALLPLRRLQHAELSGAAAGGPAKARDADGPIARFRRYPWTDAGQRQLLEYGRRELLIGHAGLAVRSFRDVLAHATHPDLRSEALVSLWLALAQQGNRDAFDAAFLNVNPEASYPWMGRTETTRIIRDRLEQGLPAATPDETAPRLDELDRRLIKIPALAPWPASWQETGDTRGLNDAAFLKAPPFIRVGIQILDGGVLVSAPNMMAGYRADRPERPVWQRTARFTESKYWRCPGIFRPPVIGGRIYTRWGEVDGRFFDVAALDSRTGRLLWSTAQDNAWRNQPRSFRGIRHWPLNDPVYADGRLYLLAARIAGVNGIMAGIVEYETEGIYLVCLDPETGAQLWSCPVSRDKLKIADRRFPEHCTDLALYGNAVTCHQGAVYCATGAGIVSRVDARDGKLEWSYRYPRTKYSQNTKSGASPREGDYAITWGAPPQVAGNRVIFTPRDANGVFALEAETGNLAWQNAFVHPSGAVGITEGALLAYDYRNVVALDLATGDTRWVRSFEEGGIRGVQRIGSSLYVGTPRGLCRLDARSGAFAERMAWDEKDRQVLDYAILGTDLYVVSDEAVPADGFETVASIKPPAADAVGKLAFPLRRAWRLARADAQLHVPPPEAGLDGRVFLLSDGVLECILLDSTPSVAWQRLVRPDLAGVRLARGMVVLEYPSRPVFLDGKTGVMQAPRLSPDPSGPNDLPSLYRATASGNRVEVANNATGERLWRRGFSQLENGTARLTGKELHVVGLRRRDHRFDALDVVCRLADGEPIATHPVLSESNAVPVGIAFSRKSCFLLAAQVEARPPFVLHRYALNGQPAQPVPGCPPFTFGGIASMSVLAESGSYIALQISGSVKGLGDPQTAVVILKEDDPSYVFVTGCTGRPEEAGARPGFIRADRYYDALPGKGVVRISDLKRRQTLVNCSIPSWDANSRDNRILEILPLSESLLVLWSRGELRIAAFDPVSGARMGDQALDDIDYTRWPQTKRAEGVIAGRVEWNNEMTGRPGMLLITDQAGLHVMAPPDRVETAKPRQPVPTLYRRREPIVLDGSLSEWARDEHAELTLRDVDGRPASVLLAQDGWRLYASLAYEDARVEPLRGEDVFCDGDWLTVEQGWGTTSAGSARFGIDLSGRILRQPDPKGGGRTLSAWAGIGYDLKTGRHVYEIAMPQAPFSLKAFEERDPKGTAQVFECDRIRVACHPLTRGEEDAVFALIRELPDLPETRGLYSRLRRFYDAWSLPMPAYSPATGPVDPAGAVDSLRKYLSVIGEESFPYSFYQLIRRFGGLDALSPPIRQWYQDKEKIESARQGPSRLSGGLCVTNWLVLGYFPYPPNTGGMGIDYLQAAGGEARHVPHDDVAIATGTGATARWRPYASPGDDVDIFNVKHLNLGMEAADQHFVVYAACWLKADKDTECELRMSSGDDSCKIYLDHEPLGDYSPVRGTPESNGPRIRLEKGLHLVLVKVAGSKLPPGAGHTGTYTFSLRVTGRSSGEPEGITVWD